MITLISQALAVIANAVSCKITSEREEAPFLTCALLSELVTKPNNVQRMTQLPTRCTVDLATKKVEWLVVDYGEGSAEGKILAINLSLFSRLSTSTRTIPSHSLCRHSADAVAPQCSGVEAEHPDCVQKDRGSYPDATQFPLD